MGEFVKAVGFRVWEGRRRKDLKMRFMGLGILDRWWKRYSIKIIGIKKFEDLCGKSVRELFIVAIAGEKKIKTWIQVWKYVLSGKGKQPFIYLDENFHLLWIWQFSVVIEASSLGNGKVGKNFPSWCQPANGIPLSERCYSFFCPILLHFPSKKLD